MNSNEHYDASDIQVLEGLEAVRKRPGMYIGSTDSRGLHHLVWEIVDNAIDEALSGYGNLIEVTICKDNSIMVQDHGRGMPTGMHASGRPTTEVILTILHAGGKFSEDGGYKTSGGLHGVGASVVNALSEWLEVLVYRDGNIYKQRYERGKAVAPLEKVGTCRKNDTGTKVTFLPDGEIFEKTRFKSDAIKSRMHETTYLNPGLTIHFEDKRSGSEEKITYSEPDGIKARKL